MVVLFKSLRLFHQMITIIPLINHYLFEMIKMIQNIQFIYY